MLEAIDLSTAYVDFDADCMLFHDLPQEDLNRLAEMSRLRMICPNQSLSDQNSPSGRVFNIVSGSGVVERISSSGRRQILAFVFPGDFVGLSNSAYFEYGIRSLTNVSAYEFPRSRLVELSEASPVLKANIQSIRDRVLALTFDQVFLLGQRRAHERLCFFLLHMLERLPGARAERIQLPMCRQDIGDFLGLTPETVSRSLAKLKRDGLIASPTPQTICIRDMERVQELADIS
ncbi:Crp/Fnr family transcriptional regulator [Haliea sp. E17]|uniref:Crp/Fnr family transcriptional regulator n=1 Tax=Haliea sp. E17 TaxID=3401576 RepID=UPI003AAC7828